MRIGTGLLIVLFLCSSPAVLQSMRTAAADTPTTTSTTAQTEPNACRGMDAKLAQQRGDQAFQRGQFELAGQCYLIAGDKPRADRAFLKATAAQAPAIKRQLADNANQVKEQFRQFREAFASH
jgi:hypothetical protein